MKLYWTDKRCARERCELRRRVSDVSDAVGEWFWMTTVQTTAVRGGKGGRYICKRGVLRARAGIRCPRRSTIKRSGRGSAAVVGVDLSLAVSRVRMRRAACPSQRRLRRVLSLKAVRA